MENKRTETGGHRTMKKIGAILTLAALLVTLSASVCFADSGKLELSD